MRLTYFVNECDGAHLTQIRWNDVHYFGKYQGFYTEAHNDSACSWSCTFNVVLKIGVCGGVRHRAPQATTLRRQKRAGQCASSTRGTVPKLTAHV